MNRTISATGLKKSFGEKNVLRGIDIGIREGEIFGLLGPSGAGKTTLINILTGQLDADGGSASICGTDTRRLTAEEHRRFGIMMDSFGIYDRLSCADNLRVFARIFGLGRDSIASALDKVGLGGSAKLPASKLSKGMTGRLKLARAFMTDPDILFLDEPTSGLDPATADEIHKMILAEKARGKTVFLTTHSMTEAEKLCDNVALLDLGRIVESGSPGEICRRYDHRKMLDIRLTDGSEIVLPHSSASAEKLAELIAGGRTETIHTTEPSLETVFMELTGKELSA